MGFDFPKCLYPLRQIHLHSILHLSRKCHASDDEGKSIQSVVRAARLTQEEKLRNPSGKVICTVVQCNEL